jgi:hypothetical protein
MVCRTQADTLADPPRDSEVRKKKDQQQPDIALVVDVRIVFPPSCAAAFA